ncbi:MAG: SDR family oxidoreductase [Alphaproteobacteria bacterium]
MPHLLCFGAGFSARALIPALLRRGWTVTGTTRSTDKLADLEAQGMAARLWGGPADGVAAGLSQADLETVTHVLTSVPPGETGDPVLAAFGATLARRAERIAWVGYLSTTGVYGDHAGGWVDETTPVAPASERGRRRADAEAGWLALQRSHGLPVHVFRLAGIYGPGRNTLETVRAGEARRIDKPGQVFSRIHVADIASVLSASMDRPCPGAVYNVCDDEPTPPQDVVAYACTLLKVSPPPLMPFEAVAPTMSPMARSFYGESKRCRNDRIKQELGVRLAYPSYREGLNALLAALDPPA